MNKPPLDLGQGMADLERTIAHARRGKCAHSKSPGGKRLLSSPLSHAATPCNHGCSCNTSPLEENAKQVITGLLETKRRERIAGINAPAITILSLHVRKEAAEAGLAAVGKDFNCQPASVLHFGSLAPNSKVRTQKDRTFREAMASLTCQGKWTSSTLPRLRSCGVAAGSASFMVCDLN